MKKTRWALAGTVGCLAAAIGTVGGHPASAASTTVLADHLVGPLGVSVAQDGTAYVAQAFAGVVTAVAPDGHRSDVLTDKTNGVSSAVPLGDGSLVYNFSKRAGAKNPVGQVRRQFKAGTADGNNVILGFIGRHEWATNPDGGNVYGFQGLTPACQSQVPAQIGGAPYKGMIDTHPYSLARLSDGSFAVADAGANAILQVKDKQVRTIAVLPPVPLTITAGIAHAAGLPDCTVGHDYDFEPVPTDVQQGPDGMLYATSLAGGPEGPGFPTGGVFKVDPTTGSVTRLAGGLSGATGIAVTQSGRVFVAQLFANQVSEIVDGKVVPFLSLPAPAAVAVRNGSLYITTDALPAPHQAPNGKLVRVDLG